MKLSQTKAQKAYAAACDACRAWAASAADETLSAVTNDSIARSYGIKPGDARNIIVNACRERRI